MPFQLNTVKPPGEETKNPLEDLLKLDKDFANYTEIAKQSISSVMTQWKSEQEQTVIRRGLRSQKIDVDKERQKRTLDDDEAFVPVRLVDTNINREQAKYAEYLTRSSRVGVFACVEDEAADCTIEEKDFTQKFRFNGWETPLLKWIDGTETHGWDFVEVLFDTDKPGHFTIEHCGHDNVLFPTDTKDFQECDFVIRLCEFTSKDLIRFCKTKGWNAAQVIKIIESSSTQKKTTNGSNAESNDKVNDDKFFKLNRLEKVFFRGDDGFIYVAWSCADICDDWVRAPKILFNGKVELTHPELPANDPNRYTRYYETAYPLEPFLYSVSENSSLMDVMGRVSLDEHKQEAATILLSSFVTGHRRAAQMYFSVGDSVNDGTNLEECQTGIKLKPGRVFKKSIKQFQLTPPDNGLLNAINTLIGQSQMESGDVNYAVSSNKSTRKTAAEVNLASQESELLNTVQVSLLSIALRNVCTRCFDIYYSRVKAGLIKVPQILMNKFLQYSYIVKPAGDTDVIERKQKITDMMKAWPVYQNTPASTQFLINLTKLLFPEEANDYIAAFLVDDKKNDLIKQLSVVLESLINDPNTNQIRPEFQQHAAQIKQLEEMIQQAVAPKQGNGAEQISNNEAGNGDGAINRMGSMQIPFNAITGNKSNQPQVEQLPVAQPTQEVEE